ncbi:MAG TPA: hypothetical protein VFU15_16365 [Bacteroidia bacterium]|nr:hypothetical protein [Bacteroidia bacterium]
MKMCALLVLLLLPVKIFAQDSLKYSPDFSFTEGIYLSFQQFRDNRPVPKSKIVSDYDTTKLNFIHQVVSGKTMRYLDADGHLVEINPGKLWGYSENNSVFIHFNGEFNRIVVIGSICHFTAYYTTYATTGPTMNGPDYGAPVENLRQYILDMQTGLVHDFVLEEMEPILQRDDAIYKEFMALRKGKRRKLMFFYLRKYNEAHPLYFKTPA